MSTEVVEETLSFVTWSEYRPKFLRNGGQSAASRHGYYKQSLELSSKINSCNLLSS